jgi:GH15 family glucan-1,4-alpha-glucosidase
VTRWLCDEGSAEVTDFMPHPEKTSTPRTLVRRLRCTRGRVRFVLRCSPRPDYARAVPTVEINGTQVLFRAGDLVLRLEGQARWISRAGSVEGLAEIAEGETLSFVLSDADAPSIAPDQIETLLSSNIEQWQAWTRSSHYKGRWRDMVGRSALTLKLLTSQQHGSVAAAATFGLPETLGGVRNWDYRATWIRDAAFTVYAFLRLGYTRKLSSSGTGSAGASRAPSSCASCIVSTALRRTTKLRSNT